MRSTIMGFSLLLMGAATSAQAPVAPKPPTDEDMRITASDLATILKNAPVSKETGKPGSISSMIFDGGNFSLTYIRIDKPDKPHTHELAEVIVVKEGSATIETGGTMIGPFSNDGMVHRAFFANERESQPVPDASGAQPNVPQSRAGTAIEGGRKQVLHPGDVLFIPSNLPHTFIAVEKPLVYLDMKFTNAQK